ncbi:MAG: hypothetical protein ACRCS0_07775 [Albidovulum sp.]
MWRTAALGGVIAGASAALAACAATGHAPKPDASRVPIYLGAEPVGMGDDLYGFSMRMRSPREAGDIDAYVTCMVAGYALQKDAAFARKLRTNVKEEGGVWIADAVYSISPELPKGTQTIDAEVTVADCEEQGIPTA